MTAPEVIRPPGELVRSRRLTLIGAVLGSGVAFLDAAVVGIALPSIGRTFGADLPALQWVVNAYLLVVCSLLLLGGTLGDAWGQRRMFLTGLLLFGAGSGMSALAPAYPILIAARAVQGAGAALILPCSLPLVSASLRGEQQRRVIASWTALVGLGAVVGPFLGGWLIDVASWRAVFVLNLPLAATAFVLISRYAQSGPERWGRRSLDLPGAATALIAASSLVVLLMQRPGGGRADVAVVSGLLAVVGTAALIVVERRRPRPMLPLRLFEASSFRSITILTTLVYAALNLALFITPLYLQNARGYSALQTAATLLPIELLLLIGSPIMGRVVGRSGPLPPLVIGPAIAALGLVLMGLAGAGVLAAAGVLPGVIAFAVGFAITVVPINTTLLNSVGGQDSGIGFGINNAAARLGGLVAIAALPQIAMVGGQDLPKALQVPHTFQNAMWFAAAMCLLGALTTVISRGQAGTGGASDRPHRTPRTPSG